MHENENIEILRHGPKKIELIALVVTVIDVSGDVRTAKPELCDCAFQDSRGPRWLLDRHRGHSGEAIRMFFEKFTHTLVV